jgi:hypothetical protein
MEIVCFSVVDVEEDDFIIAFLTKVAVASES